MSEYPELQPEDVRVGDTIRLFTHEFGVDKTYTLTVDSVFNNLDFDRVVRTENSPIFVLFRYTIRLIDRPKPKLPTDTGATILATKVRGVTGCWPVILDEDGEWFSGAYIDSRQWHKPGDIEEWILAKVVPCED